MKASFIDNLFGYVTFELWGDEPEDFINAAISEGIELWGLKREKDTLTCSARIWQIKQVQTLAKKYNLVYTEKTEKGLAPTVKKYRFRYGILAGILIICAFIFIMSRFLWKIEIVGCDAIDQTRLEEKLAEYDIKIGGKADRKDLDDVQLKLLRDFENLAFISINIKGSYAKIEVTEREMPPETIDQYDPCNIVASGAGQIVSVKTYSGVTLCKKNDVVSKGQLLVSGIFDSKYVGFRMVHAKAEIMALTEETISVVKYYDYESYERTGNVKNYYTLNILGLSLTLPFGEPEYENSEETNDSSTLKINEDLYLPMSFEKTSVYETRPTKSTRTPEEAEKAAIAEAEEQFRVLSTQYEIQDYDIDIIRDGEKVTVNYYCTILRDIAAEKEIFRN